MVAQTGTANANAFVRPTCMYTHIHHTDRQTDRQTDMYVMPLSTSHNSRDTPTGRYKHPHPQCAHACTHTFMLLEEATSTVFLILIHCLNAGTLYKSRNNASRAHDKARFSQHLVFSSLFESMLVNKLALVFCCYGIL